MKKRSFAKIASIILLVLWVVDIILSFFPVPQIPDVISFVIAISCIITSGLCAKRPRYSEQGYQEEGRDCREDVPK